MTTLFEIGGFHVTVMLAGVPVALIVWIVMAAVYHGLYRKTVWQDQVKADPGSGRILDAMGFGLLPATAILLLFAQTTPWGTGRVSVTQWIGNSILSMTDGTGLPVYAVARIEAVGALLLFALIILWLALRRTRLTGNGDLLLVALSTLGSLLILSDTLHEEMFLRVAGIRIGWILGEVLMLIPLIVWVIRNRSQRRNGGYVIACLAVFLLMTAAFAVREMTTLLGTEHLSTVLVRMVGVLLGEKAVLCLGRVSRRNENEDD